MVWPKVCYQTRRFSLLSSCCPDKVAWFILGLTRVPSSAQTRRLQETMAFYHPNRMHPRPRFIHSSYYIQHITIYILQYTYYIIHMTYDILHITYDIYICICMHIRSTCSYLVVTCFPVQSASDPPAIRQRSASEAPVEAQPPRQRRSIGFLSLRVDKQLLGKCSVNSGKLRLCGVLKLRTSGL